MHTILVIDDERDVVELIAFVLETAGYSTIRAFNGDKGLQMAYTHKPDLVLCDIRMPALDGYEVLERLYADPGMADTPFIFVSAKGQREEVEKGLRLGADDYIVKPFDPDDLLLRIQTVIIRRTLQAKKVTDSKYQVFLSYSRQDTEIMRRIYGSLAASNLKVWVDEEGLEPGTRSWRRAVQETIDKSGCIVVILSPNAKQSEWVEAELDYAESQKKVIFPILANGDRSNAIPFGYTLAQWIDVVNKDYDAEMSKLITAIRRHLNLA